MNRNNLTNFVFLAIGLLFCLPGRLQGQVMGNSSTRGVTSFQGMGARPSSMMSSFNKYSVGASDMAGGMPRTSPNPFSVSLRQSMTGPARGPSSIGATAKGGVQSNRFGMMDSARMPSNFSHLLGSLPATAAGSASAGQLRAMPSFRSRSSRANAFTTKADELGKPLLQSRRNSLTTGLTSRRSRLGRNRLGRSRLTGSLTTELTQGLTRSLTHPKTLYNTGSKLPSRAQSRIRRGLSREKIGLKRFRNRK
jgi:hypothetical protein